jgi:5'-3' exonuclease
MKVVIVDWNILVFRSIFAWETSSNRGIPPTYTALSMLVSCLKAVSCHPDDLIILALDSPKGSWRREVDANYKANRKEQREKHKDIDWSSMFSSFKYLLAKLQSSTPFVQMQIDFLEADDIISTSCRYFNDKEVHIISSDTDYEQLAYYPHVKILSPISKKYKIVKNPEKILEKKIKKERTDNLITEIVTEEDRIRREKIVTLLTLPKHIESQVIDQLKSIRPNHDFDLSLFPFKTLRDRFMTIYDNPNTQTKEVQKKVKKKKKLVIRELLL